MEPSRALLGTCIEILGSMQLCRERYKGGNYYRMNIPCLVHMPFSKERKPVLLSINPFDKLRQHLHLIHYAQSSSGHVLIRHLKKGTNPTKATDADLMLAKEEKYTWRRLTGLRPWIERDCMESFPWPKKWSRAVLNNSISTPTSSLACFIAEYL